MKRIYPVLSIALALLAGDAYADNNPVSEAVNRGLVHGKTTPKSQEMTQAQWRKQQLEAADKSEKIMTSAQKLPGLLAQYVLMQSNYDANDQLAFRLIFGQYLSWFQTWTGDYDGARKSFSIAQPAQADDAPSPLDGSYRMQRADTVILDLVKNRKAVFFNEAHSAPITRTLTVEMLARLRAEGFNYFAAETLYTTDKDLQKRGYPTLKSGFYTNEPLYGEMVRSALRLGFKVIAYDAENAGTGDAREKGGAEALYSQVFKQDPNARLVVNAGFGHVQKSGVYLGGSSMAVFFQKVTGIDPLVIDQTMLIEHARQDQDHPYYVAAMLAAHPPAPFVFVNSAGKAWTLKPGHYDVSVFFPPQTMAENRPTWPGLDGTRLPRSVSSDACRGQFPCLIEARYQNEGDDSIPADRTVLNIVDPNAPIEQRVLSTHGSAQSLLYLYPGNYRITAIDRLGRTLSSSTVTVNAAQPVAANANKS
jgi:hypothetical protein